MKNKRLAVWVGFWEDSIAMRRLLDNLKEKGVELVICIDGKHPDFPSNNTTNISQDGSHELIRSYDNTVLFSAEDKFKGLDKVNFACKYAGSLGFDYLLIMSCDEYIEGNINALINEAEKIRWKHPNEHMFGIKFDEHNKNSKNARNIGYLPRLFFKPEHVETKEVHWHRYYKGERLKAYHNLDSITIHHDDSIRPDWRNHAMDILQKKQVKEEIEIIIIKEGLDIDDDDQYCYKHCPFCNILRLIIFGKCHFCTNRVFHPKKKHKCLDGCGCKNA